MKVMECSYGIVLGSRGALHVARCAYLVSRFRGAEVTDRRQAGEPFFPIAYGQAIGGGRTNPASTGAGQSSGPAA